MALRGSSALLLLLLLTPLARAAEDPPAFGPIAPADLALKDNPADPGAAAMILLEEVTARDDKRSEHHHLVIKIFTDEGRSRANVELYSLERLNAIEEIRGRTVHADGTVSIFDGRVFDSTAVRNRRLKLQVKSFTLPAVAAGDVIEYAWTTRWKQGVEDFFVHPGNYVFDTVFSEVRTSWELQGDLYVREAHYSLYPVKGPRVDWLVFPPTPAVEIKDETDAGPIRIDLKNMPAIEKEEFSLPDEMLRPTAYFFYVAGTASRTPAYFWRAVGERRAGVYEKFVGSSRAIKDLVGTLIKPSDSSDAKLRKLYARTQQLRVITPQTGRSEADLKKEEHLRENTNVDDVLKRGYAWANEANLFFIALLRAAGFFAYPVELRSRDFGYLEPAVWDERQLNAMIVAVEVPVPCGSGSSCSDTRFLDPATPYCPYGLVPWEETGQRGLASRKGLADFVNVPAPGPEGAVVSRESDVRLAADGTLEGDLHVTYTGQPALERRREGHDLSADGRQKKIVDEIKGWLGEDAVVDAVKVDAWSDEDQPLRVEAHVRVPAYAQITSSRMLGTLNPLTRIAKNPFVRPTRKTPIYFRYTMRWIDDVTLHLPKGYAFEHVPAMSRFEDEAGSYERTSIGYSQSDGTGEVSLQVRRTFERKGFAFPAAEYALVRKLHDFVAATDAEQFVLRGPSDK